MPKKSPEANFSRQPRKKNRKLRHWQPTAQSLKPIVLSFVLCILYIEYTFIHFGMSISCNKEVYWFLNKPPPFQNAAILTNDGIQIGSTVFNKTPSIHWKIFILSQKWSFSIQSCHSCYATLHFCQCSFYKILAGNQISNSIFGR